MRKGLFLPESSLACLIPGAERPSWSQVLSASFHPSPRSTSSFSSGRWTGGREETSLRPKASLTQPCLSCPCSPGPSRSVKGQGTLCVNHPGRKCKLGHLGSP